MARNFIGFFSTLFLLLRSFLKQRSFVKKHLYHLLDDAYAENDGTLPHSKKIIFNYSTLVPVVLGEAFSKVHGTRISNDERLASSLQSAYSALGDDFFDDDRIPDADFNRLFNDLENLVGATSAEDLFVTLYKNFIAIDVNNLFQHYFYKIHKAEKESKIQEDRNASIQAIRNVTQQKGGYSVLFFRTAFTKQISANEKDLLYKLGEAVQLANDAFDIYKDHTAQVRTLVTECKDFGALIEDYNVMINEIIRLCHEVCDNDRRVRQFLQIMSLTVFSRTLVCLNMLYTLQENSNNEFNLSSYTRKQLICDMEKPVNLFHSFKYFIDFKY